MRTRTQSGPVGRRIAGLTRMVPLALALGAATLLGGCGESLDQRLGAVPTPSTNPDQPALPRATHPDLPYPNLASVPARPTDWSTPAERARQMKALNADRSGADDAAAAVASSPAAVEARQAAPAGKNPGNSGANPAGTDTTPPATDTIVPANIVPIPDAPPTVPQAPQLPGS